MLKQLECMLHRYLKNLPNIRLQKIMRQRQPYNKTTMYQQGETVQAYESRNVIYIKKIIKFNFVQK